jgi:hypothetical protein
MPPNPSSLTDELREEHGITAAIVTCPCACDANSATGNPVENCPYCHGEGRIQYGIAEVDFV